MAEAPARQNQHEHAPHVPPRPPAPQQDDETPEHERDALVPARQRRVENMPAVQLGDRQQVQHRHQHPHPAREGDGMDTHGRRSTEHQPLDQQRDQRVAQRNLGTAAEVHGEPRCSRLHRHGVTQRQSGGEHRQRDQESGDRSGHADVEQLAAIGQHRAQPDERAHGADERREHRHGNEVRGRDVQLIAARDHIVAELVAQQNGQEGSGKRESGGPGLQETGIARVSAREENQVAGVRDAVGEHGASERDGVERGEEQEQVESPALAPSNERTGEHQVPAVGLVRPVVTAGPLSQHLCQPRGWASVRRMYKCVNNFAVWQGRRAPGQQEVGDGHAALLTGAPR